MAIDFGGKIFQMTAGAPVLKEGEMKSEMYKIIKGHVEVYIGYGTDKETLIGILGPQDCFGEFGILLHEPSAYTVIAYSDIMLLRITEGEIGDFVQQNHKNIIQIMQNMARTIMTMRLQIDMLLNDMEHGIKPDEKAVHEIEKTMKGYSVYGKDSGRFEFRGVGLRNSYGSFNKRV
ncbi:MAG: cyclic nucleotide-binding domain-containing protein [Lachnospiraceae bacterium]|nr:cyclic nucleotide-binding domain-containing protein [Lachnospiraceae bacterium]